MLFPLCPQLIAREEIVFTILSLQSTEVPTIYLKSKGFNILRRGVGPGKVDDFTLVIYLTLTGETFSQGTQCHRIERPRQETSHC